MNLFSVQASYFLHVFGLFSPCFLFNRSCFSFAKPFSLHLPRYEERSGWPSPLLQKRTSISLVIHSLSLSVDLEIGRAHPHALSGTHTQKQTLAHTHSARVDMKACAAHTQTGPRSFLPHCSARYHGNWSSCSVADFKCECVLFYLCMRVYVRRVWGASFVRRASWPVRLISCWTEKRVCVY